MVTVSIDNLELIHSVFVITVKGKPTTVTLNDEEGGSDLNLIFEFVDDDKEKEDEHKKDFSIINDTTLKITFTNYNSFLGGGNNDLINIGLFKSRRLYLNYRIFSLKGAGQTILINLYLGEEVPNEQ